MKGQPFAESWPVTAISLDLTENCSLRCQYCFCGEKTTREIDEKTARDAIDWLLSPEVSGSEKNLQIDFWGGEAFLKWDLAKELIIYGRRQAEKVGKRLTFNTTTNGVHLTEKVCREIALAGLSFMLSLDGIKEVQDRNRPLAGGGSSYDVIVKNLPHMMGVYGGLRARITVREDDVDHLFESVVHLHKDLGIPQISHSLAHETAWTYESLQELKGQLELIGDWYVEEKLVGNEKLWVKFIDDAVGRLLYPRPLSYFCGAGRGYLAVSVDGVIYPCHRFHQFADERPWAEQAWAMGTIYEGLVKPEIRNLFIQAKDRLGYCKGCDLAAAGTCQGSCPAVNWVKSGQDILRPAHSGCQEMHFAQAVGTSVYQRLVGVPAFRTNLARIARERRRPQHCNEPGHECEAPGQEYVMQGLKAEIQVLSEALAVINEAVRAIQEVTANALTDRQFQLELLAAIENLKQGGDR